MSGFVYSPLMCLQIKSSQQRNEDDIYCKMYSKSYIKK